MMYFLLRVRCDIQYSSLNLGDNSLNMLIRFASRYDYFKMAKNSAGQLNVAQEVVKLGLVSANSTHCLRAMPVNSFEWANK